MEKLAKYHRLLGLYTLVLNIVNGVLLFVTKDDLFKNINIFFLWFSFFNLIIAIIFKLNRKGFKNGTSN